MPKVDTQHSEALHRDAIVVDTHNDLVQTLVVPELGRRAKLGERWIPDLRAGGVDVQVCPLFTHPQVPEAQLRETLRQLIALKREARANANDVAICRTGAEIEAAVASGRIALVVSMEGAMALASDPGMVEIFYDLGVRMISFTHMGRTMLADGSAEDATGGRLTRAGIAALREMERLGVVVDVSHLGIAGVDHVLELATRPVIASHSAVRAVFEHHRNLSDTHLRGIAATGGVIGINMLACFVDPARATIDRIVDHIEHAVAVAGSEHVGIGADFISEVYDDLYPTHMELGGSRQNVEGLYAPRHLPRLTEALLGRGFTDDQVRLILGANFLRVFRQVLGAPAVS